MFAASLETAPPWTHLSYGPGDGWSGIKNGARLSLAEGEFDALITIDQGFEYQQSLKERRIAILLLVSRSNQIEDLAPIVPAALTALETILPGQVVRIGE
jgi:hypothetical protein